MTPHELVDKLSRLKTEGDVTYADLITEDLSDLEVAELWLAADFHATRANQVAKIIGGEWVERYLENGAVEVGDYLVYATDGSKWERCPDPESFWSHVETEYEVKDVARWFNPNQAKMGSLPPAVRDTFFEKGITRKPEKAPASVPLEMIR